MRTIIISLFALSYIAMPHVVLAAETSTVAVIDGFYHRYLTPGDHTKDTPPLSSAFKAAIAANAAVCKENGATDVCGWSADGDPYLDSQESDVTYATSGIAVTETSPGTVRVKLNIYPSATEEKSYYDRTITYKMVREGDAWLVDDILYDGGVSARESIATEVAFYRKHPATKAAGK